jgi:probable F420-dependent oxidoreductase
MKFGIVLPPESGSTSEPDWVRIFAQHAEQVGFDEISVVEHSVVISDTTSVYPYSPTGRSPLPDDCPLPDPLELLAFIAGMTSRLGLATGVLVLPNHQPIVLAKRLATLDRLSGGRLRICLGLGWMREEIEACSGNFERRGAHADEAIALMRALWLDEEAEGVSFHGSAYHVDGAHSWPKPVRPSGVPLFIGGHSKAAAQRAGRLGDGFQPLGLKGDELVGALAMVRETAVLAERDPSEIEIVLGGTLDRIDETRIASARHLGASRILLSVSSGATTLDAILKQMTQCALRIGLDS